MCKKILRLLIFFAFITSQIAVAQTFSSCDFARLLSRHPLMKDFQPETGRFRNTSSEIIPVEKVQAQIASAEAEIASFNRRRENLLAGTLSASEKLDESKVWSELSQLAEEVQKRKRLLLDLRELEATKGIPPVSRVLSISRQIILEARDQMPSADIVLNQLPRFYLSTPDYEGNPLRSFFNAPERKEFFYQYLAGVNQVGQLFKSVSMPILVGERKSKK